MEWSGVEWGRPPMTVTGIWSGRIIYVGEMRIVLDAPSIHEGPPDQKRFLLIVTMANSGVTPEGLKATLAEKVQATHVEIEDMSG